MASQLWDLALISLVVSVDGIGNTVSDSAGSAGVPQRWDLQFWDGITAVSGQGNTSSSGVGSGSAENATWYDIDVSVTSGSGFGNTLSQAADFAPFTIISPPSVTGFGDTISSAYGTALRSFNSIGQDTEGSFDVDQQTTDSVLVRPTASGDFIIDGLPLPS